MYWSNRFLTPTARALGADPDATQIALSDHVQLTQPVGDSSLIAARRGGYVFHTHIVPSTAVASFSGFEIVSTPTEGFWITRLVNIAGNNAQFGLFQNTSSLLSVTDTLFGALFPPENGFVGPQVLGASFLDGVSAITFQGNPLVSRFQSGHGVAIGTGIFVPANLAFDLASRPLWVPPSTLFAYQGVTANLTISVALTLEFQARLADDR